MLLERFPFNPRVGDHGGASFLKITPVEAFGLLCAREHGDGVEGCVHGERLAALQDFAPARIGPARGREGIIT